MAKSETKKNEEVDSKVTSPEADLGATENSAEEQMKAKEAEMAAREKEIEKKEKELAKQVEKLEKEKDALKSAKPKAAQVSDTPPKEVVERDRRAFSTIRAKLAAEEKVPLFIPLQPFEKKGSRLDGAINGYAFSIAKGKYVHVPVSIATLVMESLNQTTEALYEKVLDNKIERGGAEFNDGDASAEEARRALHIG